MGDRDTKFAGFAKNLTYKLDPLFTGLYQAIEQNDMRSRDEFKQHIQTLIAQHDYDLVTHTIINLPSVDEREAHLHGRWYSTDGLVQAIPDMPEEA
jgi:hypothetical protein